MEKQPPFTTPGDAAPLDVLILAAGLGMRMRSRTAKVLHQLGGRPLIAHVCRTASALSRGVSEHRPIYVIVGHQAEEVKRAVRDELGEEGAIFITQREQRGTGDAVMVARDALAEANSTLLILSGDVPLVRAETLAALINQHRTHRGRGAACTALTVRLDDPTGYGRIVRDTEGRFERIVEQRTRPRRSADQRDNAGISCFNALRSSGARRRAPPLHVDITDGCSRDLCAAGEAISLFFH